MLDTLFQDLRYSLRALRHSRGFAIWVIGSLAIGMAVTIAALALLNALLILPFPEVTEQKRLVRVSVSRNCGRPDCWRRMSASGDYDALRAGLTGLQGLAAYTVGEIAVALPKARSMRGVFTSVTTAGRRGGWRCTPHFRLDIWTGGCAGIHRRVASN